MNKSEQTIAKALGTETTKLTIANMVLRAENKELKQEIAKLKQDNVELKQEIAELRHHDLICPS